MNHNQHGVYAADGKIEAGKKLPLTDVGATFYPNLVLLNHSCSPNTIRINEGNRVGDTDRINFLDVQLIFLDIFDCKAMHQGRRGNI